MAGTHLFPQAGFDPRKENYQYGLDEAPRRVSILGRAFRGFLNLFNRRSSPSPAEQKLINELRDIM